MYRSTTGSRIRVENVNFSANNGNFSAIGNNSGAMVECILYFNNDKNICDLYEVKANVNNLRVTRAESCITSSTAIEGHKRFKNLLQRNHKR